MTRSRGAKLRRRGRPVLEHCLGDVALYRREIEPAEVVGAPRPAGVCVERRQHPRRHKRSPAPEMLADAREATLGQLVLPRPAARHLRREHVAPVLVDDAPVHLA